GGVVCGTKHYIRKVLEPYLKHTGAAMSPFNAWVMLKGMETLDLRVRQQAASAQAVAEALQGHAKLEQVIYPGLKDHPHHRVAMDQMGAGGTVVTLVLKGGQDAAFRFLNALEIIKISNNIGDAKSIITHPATTTHQRLPPEQKALLGIAPGLVRLSLGIEDTGDILADLTGALAGL
ncbi:MAG: PLP-dependent transferase, partial [Rhodobacteraceae bacterium]|nr:PLP-dependent transferase [Paracoccaceae bacterium]